MKKKKSPYESRYHKFDRSIYPEICDCMDQNPDGYDIKKAKKVYQTCLTCKRLVLMK
jgi:hypothetical protein